MTFPSAKVGLDAGKLRHRVTIQRQTVGHDSDGGRKVTWDDVATVWAAIEPLSARERLVADQVQSEVTARITIRYRDDVDATMRVKHGDDLYNIHGVIRDNESMFDWITLPVSIGLNDG